MTVVRLIDEQKSPSTLSWNMVQLLEESIEDIKNSLQPNKGLILFLDDSNDQFKLCGWKKAGILHSQAIALVDIFKNELIEILRDES